MAEHCGCILDTGLDDRKCKYPDALKRIDQLISAVKGFEREKKEMQEYIDILKGAINSKENDGCF